MKKLIKKAFRKANLFQQIGIFEINRINLQEYKNPVFGSWNERPVEYRFVFEAITELYPKEILDVGTGLTALPHLMANCGTRVTAIDNIKDYWQEGMTNRHFLVIDDDIQAPKIDKKFDLITCVSTLEHITDPEKAVKSMFRLLNSGGHLLLSFPYNEKKRSENVYRSANSQTKSLPPYPTRAYSRADLERWQKENSAVIKKQEYWQFYEGEYWTEGKEILPPRQTGSDSKHQISCILFQKLGK